MATKPSWSTVSPLSGSGSGTTNTSGTKHTGRAQRSGTITYKASGVADVLQSITQSAKPEFVTINDVSAAKSGGNVTITGKSNSSKLSFTLGAGSIVMSLPPTYVAGGATTNNNAVITGDPGASAEYDFSITVNVPANTTAGSLTRVITVTANGGQAASSTITQAAGDLTLSISPMSITLDWEGTAVATTVTSNTNWTVE